MNSLDLIDMKVELQNLVYDFELDRQSALKEKFGWFKADRLQKHITKLQKYIVAINKELSQGCNLNESTLVNTSNEAYMSFDKAARRREQ